MEFLMTYGWVILLVIVAVSALFYFRAFDPASLVSEACDFGSVLDCRDFEVTRSGVALSLFNHRNNNLIIQQISLSSDALEGECRLFCGSGNQALDGREEKDFAVLLGGCGFRDTGRSKNNYDISVSYKRRGSFFERTVKGRLLANRPCEECVNVGVDPPGFIDVELTAVPSSLAENLNSPRLTVNASVKDGTLCDFNSTILLEHADGTARLGQDYALPDPLPSIVIPEGRSSGSASFNVRLVDDNTDTGTRTFGIVGRSGGFNVSAGTITILDDDGAAAATLSVSPASLRVTEGNSGYAEASLNVSLSAPVPGGASVMYATSDGTARSPQDYAEKSGTLRFGPAQTLRTIRINVTGDRYWESNETFSLALSRPVNASISRGTGTVTIVNDDSLADVCSRTPEVLNEILSELGTANCADVTSENLTQITTLDFYRESISSLKAGDFDGLTNLPTLSLSNTLLSSWPSGIFDGLSSLRTLDLTYNGMSSLPPGTLGNLNSLRTLRLNNNRLSSLPSGIFDNLTSLQALHLSNNLLTSWPSGIFDNLTSLRTLDMSYNGMASLPSGIFDNLTSLRTLRLNNNRLPSLPSGTFDRLNGLQTLYLHNNRFSSLPSGTFDRLNGLQTLSISQNLFSSLPSGISNLTSLQSLYLDRNRFSSLSPGTFDKLNGLQNLSLNGNRLASLPSGIFDNATSLRTLHLNNNLNLRLNSGIFARTTQLRSIRISPATNSTLPSGIFDNVTGPLSISVW